MRSGIYGEYPSLREKDQLEGDLQGANLGLVAFKVLFVDTLPGFSSLLAHRNDSILDAHAVCDVVLGLISSWTGQSVAWGRSAAKSPGCWQLRAGMDLKLSVPLLTAIGPSGLTNILVGWAADGFVQAVAEGTIPRGATLRTL